jgi:hypothetical protein
MGDGVADLACLTRFKDQLKRAKRDSIAVMKDELLLGWDSGSIDRRPIRTTNI